MDAIWQAVSLYRPRKIDYEKIEFWVEPERAGYLSRQGEVLKTWRRRWFVLKQDRLLWFKHPDDVTNTAVPRGVVRVDRCHSIISADEYMNKPNSLLLVIDGRPVFFIADTQAERERWLNSLARVLVNSANTVTHEIHDYGQSSRS